MGLFDTVKDAFSGSATGGMWNSVTDPSQIDNIIEESGNRIQLIYKHSHRCSVCFISRGNLESVSKDILKHADMHFLNVLRNRESSGHIATELDVRHESPQVILLVTAKSSGMFRTEASTAIKLWKCSSRNR